MSWTWTQAGGPDVSDIVAIARGHFETEIDQIFTPDPVAYARNLTLAAVNQFYSPGSELLRVARSDQTNAVVGYVWVNRGQRGPWSDEEMAYVRMVHVDLNLPVRDRLRLIQEMLLTWEQWALSYAIPIVCSTTMRKETQGFLKLHARHGYDVRGSFAYKRLIAKESNVKT